MPATLAARDTIKMSEPEGGLEPNTAFPAPKRVQVWSVLVAQCPTLTAWVARPRRLRCLGTRRSTIRSLCCRAYKIRRSAAGAPTRKRRSVIIAGRSPMALLVLLLLDSQGNRSESPVKRCLHRRPRHQARPMRSSSSSARTSASSPRCGDKICLAMRRPSRGRARRRPTRKRPGQRFHPRRSRARIGCCRRLAWEPVRHTHPDGST